MTKREELESAVLTFLNVRLAYRDCSREVRKGVDEMLAIIESPESSPEERKMALHTVVDALY